MLSESCTLSLLAGPTDARFLEPVAEHLVKQHPRPFEAKILIVDDLPSTDGTPAAERSGWVQFEKICAALERGGLFTLRTFLSQVSSDLAIINKHFDRRPPYLRDFRRVPLCGWIAGLESSTCRFHVHFDSDIFVHQQAGFDWISEGIGILQRQNDVLCVAPHPGPPRRDGVLLDQEAGYSADAYGNYVFTSFSSRRFLVDRERFKQLLPLPVSSASRRLWLKAFLTGQSPLHNWEALVSRRMMEACLRRVHLKTASAWALHAPEHGPAFVDLLPVLIPSIEHGWYPPEQAGRYDLDLGAWKSHSPQWSK